MTNLPRTKLTDRWVILALMLAGLAGAAGFAWLNVVAHRPGPMGVAPSSWPADLSLARAADRFTVVMFAHPQCPCTDASLEALGGLLGRLGGQVEPWVVVDVPADAPADWAASENWDAARRIAGERVVPDPSGAIAARFGAQTSGTVVVYDPGGALVFQGGVTPERGQLGASVGARAIERRVLGEAARAVAPVFGCELSSGGAP